MDIARLTDEYIVWHEVRGHSSNTIALSRWVLNSFRQWLVANERPTTINAITIGDVRSFLLQEQQRDFLVMPKSDTPSRTGKLSDRSIHTSDQIHPRLLHLALRRRIPRQEPDQEAKAIKA